MTLPVVSIVMLTYGHEKYIAQAINGVLEQQTEFPIELIIANDCSPDNTDEVIKNIITTDRRANIIQYKKQDKNRGIEVNAFLAIEQAKGKYLAVCEGDDYWVDPLKLKKQVDFLENNNSYGLVATRRKNYNQTTGEFTIPDFNFDGDFKSYRFEDIIISSEIATLTALVRKELFDEYLSIRMLYKDKPNLYDYSLGIYFSYRMKVAILKDITAVYRILPVSASHNKDIKVKWNLKKKYFNDFRFFMSYLDVDPALKDHAEYLRAKSFYAMAGRSGDKEASHFFLEVFKKNKDHFRYNLLKVAMRFRPCFKIAFYIEIVLYRTKRFLSSY